MAAREELWVEGQLALHPHHTIFDYCQATTTKAEAEAKVEAMICDAPPPDDDHEDPFAVVEEEMTVVDLTAEEEDSPPEGGFAREALGAEGPPEGGRGSKRAFGALSPPTAADDEEMFWGQPAAKRQRLLGPSGAAEPLEAAEEAVVFWVHGLGFRIEERAVAWYHGGESLWNLLVSLPDTVESRRGLELQLEADDAGDTDRHIVIEAPAGPLASPRYLHLLFDHIARCFKAGTYASTPFLVHPLAPEEIAALNAIEVRFSLIIIIFFGVGLTLVATPGLRHARAHPAALQAHGL